MKVLRRRADNAVQFASFAVVALAFGAIRHDLVGLAIALPAAVLAVRGLRNGLYAGPDDVVVRNTFRTHRIPRTDIERIDMASAGRPPLPAVVIRRRSGPPVPLWSVMPAGRGRRGREALVPVMVDVQRAVGLDS